MPELSRCRPTCRTLVALFTLASPLTAADGDVLTTGVAAFDVGGGLTDTAKAVAVQADGKIVLVGTVNTGTNTWGLAVSRSLSNGTLDSSFGTNGRVVNPFGIPFSTFGNAVALLADGRILVAGSQDWGGGDFDFLIGRLLANGQPDMTFASGSGFNRVAFNRGGDLTDEVAAMAIDSSGRILVAGTVDTGASDRDFAVTRLLATGSGDSTFGINSRAVIGYPNAGVDVARAVTLDGSGRILVGGATHTSATFDCAVVRLLDSGAPDTTFGGGEGRWYALHDGGNDYVNALAVQPDGRILLAGEDWLAAGLWGWMVQRLLPDGNWDTSFSDDGFQGGNFACGVGMGCDYRDTAWGLALQGDGKIVIGGAGRGASNIDFGASRLHPDGTSDYTFGFNDSFVYDGTMVFDFNHGLGSDDDYGYALALAPDGRLVVAGSSQYNGFDTDFAWVRLDNAYIFADGFEWGSSARWSATAP